MDSYTFFIRSDGVLPVTVATLRFEGPKQLRFYKMSATESKLLWLAEASRSKLFCCGFGYYGGS